MPNKKHYIITAITLGAIAAASAVLIASANLITKKRIEKNEENSDTEINITQTVENAHGELDK